MSDIWWVGLGGFCGANIRYWLGLWLADRFGAVFPYGTLVINVTGSLLIGVLLVLLTERLSLDPAWRLLLVVGFLGGYTTFSSYMWEALSLLQEGSWVLASAYILGSTTLGLLAVVAGAAAARSLIHG